MPENLAQISGFAASGASVGARQRGAWMVRRAPACIVFFSILTLLLCVSDRLLNDPDTQWHIAAGRWIWTHGRVPWVDPFSHTFAGQSWIAKEWLSQLVLFGARTVAGWWGVALLAASVVAASFAFLYAWLGQRIRASLALCLVLVALVLLAPQVLARPHIFVVPVMMAWTMALVTALERGRAPAWWAPLLMVLWTNLHASFPIGLVVATILAGEAVFAAPVEKRFQTAVRWALFLAASTLATLVSPYGIFTLKVIFDMAGSAEALRYIAEWQPLPFELPAVAAVGAALLAVAVLAPDWRRNLFRIGAVLLLASMTLDHARFMSVFAVFLPILVVDPCVRQIPSLKAEAEGPGGNWMKAALCLSFAAVVAAAALAAPEPRPQVYPTAAFGAAQAQGLEGPVYNAYDFGGFLIDHGVKTFIDGRADQLFLGGFMDALEAALDAQSDAPFARILDRYHVTWALVQPDAKDARHLARMAGWTQIYADDTARVFARR